MDNEPESLEQNKCDLTAVGQGQLQATLKQLQHLCNIQFYLNL